MSHPLLIKQWGPQLSITLNRPELRNALNRELLDQLMTLFLNLPSQQSEIDLVILRGAGGHLCAGGDIREMAAVIQGVHSGSLDLNVAYELNATYGRLLHAMSSIPQTLITVVEGASLGGGLGLACVADVTLAHVDAYFGLPETKIGLVPAQVAAQVVRRIGVSNTKRLALLGEEVTAIEGKQMGLVHELFSDESMLIARLDSIRKGISTLAPKARAETKAMLQELWEGEMVNQDWINRAATGFTHAISSAEFTEGSKALRDRRAPPWIKRWDLCFNDLIKAEET